MAGDPADDEPDGGGLERVVVDPAHRQRAGGDRADDHDTTGPTGFKSKERIAATTTARRRAPRRSPRATRSRARWPALRLRLRRRLAVVGAVQVVLHRRPLCGGRAGRRKKIEFRRLALLDSAIVRVLPAVPRRVVRRLSDRYIAGPELADAVATVRALNATGKKATLDVLGEEVATAEEALAIRAEYEQAMSTIEEEGLDANVSVKLTGLGLKVDPELCAESVRALVRLSAGHGRFVRIDMEDSSTTTATLDLYRGCAPRATTTSGSSCRRCSGARSTTSASSQASKPNVRVCKGIYVEPAEIAYQGDEAIRFNFVETIAALWESGAKVAVATHDDALVAKALELIREGGLGLERYEFQLLLGVREDLADELVRGGHTVRIYVPYGQKWYEYSLRRLQENPKLAGYVARDVFRQMRP